MGAVPRRLWRFVGVYGLLAILVVSLVAAAVVAGGWSVLTVSNAWVIVRPGLIVVIVLVLGIGAVVRYRRSSRTRPAGEVVSPLVRSGRAYCLVLRAFGKDGYMILPRPVFRDHLDPYGAGPNLTIEQTVALAARASSMETYGIVDQGVRLAPPGPTFVRASDEEWQSVASRLIRHARVIVLLLGPDQDLTGGFRWEIEQIVAHGRAARVVIGLPPPDQDEAAHRAAVTQACALLVSLGTAGRIEPAAEVFAVREYELSMPDDVIVIAHTPRIGIGWWVAVDPGGRSSGPSFLGWTPFRKKTSVSSVSYSESFAEAFGAVEQERRGVGP